MSFDYLVELKDITWGETIGKKDKPVIVMFYSPSCPHCQQMDPYFELYSKKFKDKVVFAKINILENPSVVGKYGIMGTPTFKFFCDGYPVQELVGAIYPTLLEKYIEDVRQQIPECIKNTTWIDPGITGYA